MADMNRIIEGLKMLQTVVPMHKQYCSAEHDIIYAGGRLDDLTPEQVDTLNDYGWYWDEDLESWYTFT